MAFTSTLIWEVRTGGSDTNNSGGFDPGQSANMLTDGAATSATGNSPVFSSASYNFVAADVGAWIYIHSGTNWTPGWYKIASVASNVATLSAAIGEAQTLSTRQPNITAGCATTGSPTGATWSIDYSQQNSPVFSYTDLSASGAGDNATSAGHPFGKQQVGNCIVVTGGTNLTTGVYIVSSVSGTTAALTTRSGSFASGVSSNGTGGMGGALASPGKVGGLWAASNLMYIQSGTYSITSASTNIAGGCLSINTGGTLASPFGVIGYQTVRGDYGTRPLLQASGISSFSIISNGNALYRLHNLSLDGASLTSSGGMNLSGTDGEVYLCKVANCTSRGITFSTTGEPNGCIIQCEVTGCTSAPFQSSYCFGCIATANTVTGFQRCVAVDCISYANTGANTDGFSLQGDGDFCENCTSDGNGRNGFFFNNTTGMQSLVNCLATNNGGYGFTAGSAGGSRVFVNCAGYTNSSGNVNTTNINSRSVIRGFITLTADPYVNRAGGNFSPNTTAGGVAIRGLGAPSSFPGGLTASYRDVGAAQHADPNSIIVNRRRKVR